MKKYLLKATGIAAMAVLLSTSSFSQEDKIKAKTGDGDEIIIIKKSGKDNNVTVEVKNGEVTVNGKPWSEYKGDDIVVQRGKASLKSGHSYSITTSPFREGQVWSYSNDGGADRAYLGVTTEKDDKGARIKNINENTAASKAGLKEDDVITRIDDTKIEDPDDLSTAVRKHKPEEKVNVTYLRDGKEQKATATLGKQSSLFSTTAPRAEAFGGVNLDGHFNFDGYNNSLFAYGRPRLGIRAQDTEDGKGVKVLNVDENSPAEKAGITKNDIITEFNGKEIKSADDLADAARAVKDKSSMSVKLNRDGRAQTIEIKIPKKLKTTNL